MKPLYKYRKENKLCVMCGSPAAPKKIGQGVGTRCKECQLENQAKTQLWLYNKSDVERQDYYKQRAKIFISKHPGYANKYANRVRVRRNRAGLCIQCGSIRDNETQRCNICRDKARTASREYKRRKALQQRAQEAIMP